MHGCDRLHRSYRLSASIKCQSKEVCVIVESHLEVCVHVTNNLFTMSTR